MKDHLKQLQSDDDGKVPNLNSRLLVQHSLHRRLQFAAKGSRNVIESKRPEKGRIVDKECKEAHDCDDLDLAQGEQLGSIRVSPMTQFMCQDCLYFIRRRFLEQCIIDADVLCMWKDTVKVLRKIKVRG